MYIVLINFSTSKYLSFNNYQDVINFNSTIILIPPFFPYSGCLVLLYLGAEDHTCQFSEAKIMTFCLESHSQWCSWVYVISEIEFRAHSCSRSFSNLYPSGIVLKQLFI